MTDPVAQLTGSLLGLSVGVSTRDRERRGAKKCARGKEGARVDLTPPVIANTRATPDDASLRDPTRGKLAPVGFGGLVGLAIQASVSLVVE